MFLARTKAKREVAVNLQRIAYAPFINSMRMGNTGEGQTDIMVAVGQRPNAAQRLQNRLKKICGFLSNLEKATKKKHK